MGSGHTLNRIGERGSPCLTPWLILICLVSPFAVAKVVIAPSYRSSTTLMNWVGTPNLMSPFTNRLCEMVLKTFTRSRNATARVPFSFFCFHIRCSGRTEFSLTPGAGMKPHCEGWRLIALVSLFASIFVYSLKSTLLIDSGCQCLACLWCPLVGVKTCWPSVFPAPCLTLAIACKLLLGNQAFLQLSA